MQNWLRSACAVAAAGILAFCSASVRAAGAASAAQPDIKSASAIVADADSGQIYYQKDIHARLYPASITKILTGLVAAEHAQPSDTVTIPQDVAQAQRRDMANIALKSGDTMTMNDLQYALFVASANDAAIAIAEHVGGTMDAFLNRMNQKAAELGTKDSHFSTPNGLPDPNNYTSAYDMALITQAALQNQTVLRYFSTASYVIRPGGQHPKPIYLVAKHKMRQKDSKYYDPDVFAGKTGWETMSGNTLVTAAKRNGRTLIAVMLKGDSAADTFSDTKALLDYAFAQPASAQAAALPYLSVQRAKAAVASQTAQARQQAADAARSTTKGEASRGTGPLDPYLLLAMLCAGAFFLVFMLLVRRRIRGDGIAE